MKHGPIALLDEDDAGRLRRDRLARLRQGRLEHPGDPRPRRRRDRDRHRRQRGHPAPRDRRHLRAADASVPRRRSLAVVPLQLLAYRIARLRGSTSTSRGTSRRPSRSSDARWGATPSPDLSGLRPTVQIRGERRCRPDRDRAHAARRSSATPAVGERVFTEAEQRVLRLAGATPPSTTRRALPARRPSGKALGCGVRFTWREIEIAGRPKPEVRLSGSTKAFAGRVRAGPDRPVDDALEGAGLPRSARWRSSTIPALRGPGERAWRKAIDLDRAALHGDGDARGGGGLRRARRWS